ncbi:hypothetical protein [Pediococcus ethanolidurans]|uniref:Uncharacterized protein n=1 Tax=Pediococcus ethanolidurans TaxID=319653 RepID=A0A0R2K6E3_9LACO|nr:hypothetical protein [Pediococcus ethanolidurans]KRN82885.1 hypothetical protein IV87_GL001839 [Pediococcus ethanolidurans]GEN94701.1 hypothetical protein PET01_07510 [Pediococcus ethanolidurans]SER18051.1 hypothetical protein SAMN04487973_102158 [Pediococcus ethanolidurans]
METSNTNDHTIKSTDGAPIYQYKGSHAKKDFDVRKDGIMGVNLNGNKVELDDGMLPDVIASLRAQVADLFGTVSKLETTITELRSDDYDKYK